MIQQPSSTEDQAQNLLHDLAKKIAQLPGKFQDLLTPELIKLENQIASTTQNDTERKGIEEEQKAAAARDAYRVRLADALRPLTDPVAIQTEAVRVLGEYLGASRVMYGEVAEGGEDLIIERNYVANGSPLLTGRFRMADFGPVLVEAMHSGRTTALPDIAAEPALSAAEREAFAAPGIASALSVPLTKAGRFVANLTVHHTAPRAWSECEVALIEETAERTWAAVERAQAEKTLRESEATLRVSEEKYRDLFNSIDEGFCIIEVLFDENEHPIDYRFLEANAMFEEQTGIRNGIGRRMREIAPNHEEYWFEIYGRIAKTGQALRFENPAQQLNRYYDVYAFRVGQPEERKVAVLFKDISPKKRAEAELAHMESVRQEALKEREIHHRLTEQREMERQSIARDIHDGPVQTLSSLLFNLHSLREALADPALQLEVDNVKLNIKSSVQELRQIMYELRPPSVIQFGVSKAIQSFTENLREHHPRISWNLTLADDEQLLSQQVCLTLFRIYQEAVANIIRHSEARHAWVTIEVGKDQVVLEVRDDGKGFVRSQDMVHLTERKHFGLAGIAERAQAIDGVLEIQSQPGVGTVIKVNVPIDH